MKINIPEGNILNYYNTPLSDEDQRKYNIWRSQLPKPLQSTRDYDLQGYYLNIGKNINPKSYFPHITYPTGYFSTKHITDEYKKPNHPTFSNESKYSSIFTPGGFWVNETYFNNKLMK